MKFKITAYLGKTKLFTLYNVDENKLHEILTSREHYTFLVEMEK